MLCTNGDPDVITAAIPKEAADIEAIVGSETLARV